MSESIENRADQNDSELMSHALSTEESSIPKRGRRPGEKLSETAAEYMRAYRLKRKALKAVTPKPVAKSSTQRNQEYRQRKKEG